MTTCVFFLRIRRPPRSTRTDTLFPYTTLFRSKGLVYPDLELAAREVTRTRHMAAPIGVAFAHVEDNEIVALPADPPRKLLQRHERNGRRRFGQKLPHRLSARDISTKRFGQMTRRAEIEPAHHLDEGSALPLLKPGLVGQLRRDGRMAQTLIVMRRIDQRLTIQLQQLVEKAVIKLFGVDRKSTRLNSSPSCAARMTSS